MKIYVAAMWGRRDEMRNVVVPRVLAAGHVHMARWLEDYGGKPLHPQMTMEGALTDLADIDASDAVLWYTQPIGSMNSGGGRHFEAGYAFAKGKKVVAVGEHEIIFTMLPSIVVCSTLDLALNYLDNIEEMV